MHTCFTQHGDTYLGSQTRANQWPATSGSDVLNRVHLFAEPQDRDGFCGHEVVGVVVESKSEKFKAGDEVMALPSSYFKAHPGKFQA